MTTAKVKRISLLGGPLLGLLCYYLLPSRYATGPGEWVEVTQAGRATLAMMVWMAGWWLTEAVDIEATALLPIVTFPLLGIAPLNKVLPPYAADVIFLFMGGFIIGLAIERWGLDRRLAFFTLRLVGARPRAIVGGFMAVTAFLSMWVSNTACAAMMVPIAMSVVDLVLRSRIGAGLKEFGGFPKSAFRSATSPPVCCSASRTRHRSAASRPSSARHPMASPCATSSKPSARK
jgi:solute carrier family 13 (sodium-dependent dicarboxylate transporter), member 2/3/5